ncbi:MAG: lysophospholipid acyltransferase family protein [Puniceicoccaceae bacterium]
MNLVRPQTPYQFMAPKYSRAFRPVLHLLVRLSQRYEFHVKGTTIEGAEELTKLVKAGQSVLIAPNHADHADPGLMLTVGRRFGFAPHFMAAREGFEKSALHRWVLQRAGAFSINREGADLAAIKMAIHVLQEGKFPLVIFPEGEIYHHMEELDELNDGVASIALRAATKLPEGRRGYAVPASIRLKHDPSVEECFSDRLSVLEKRILLKPRIHDSAVDRIFRLGAALLAVKEEEYLGAAQQGTLTERIHRLRSSIMQTVEAAHGINHDDLSFPKRIKLLRARIRKELTEGDGEPEAKRKEELYDHLDDIFVVHQLYSYPRTYLLGEPSVDRIAETIFKLEEDMLGKARYLGKRKAEIRFAKPIDLGSFLEQQGLNAKSGIDPLTREIEDRIMQLLAR